MMRASRSSRLLALVVTWALVWASVCTAYASDIVIEEAALNEHNGILVLDADSHFDFSADAIEALNSGIPLYFDLEVRLLRARRYLWDVDIFTTRRRYAIERHALSNQFVLTELITGERRLHRTLELAIEDLSRIRRLPLVEAATLELPPDLAAAIRIELDINALPAPMIPLAYVSPGWHMSSGWYQWPVVR
ncbi:MAG: DUF4390 domain-containing protein [Gammaproteobacteria bacterium]|nr:DUF4390 domain-containing protein [Gammaproteobacteria bacterium]